ncbi:MAG: fimbrillin family protein [Prevotella sp.]|nr:fimbrillin family protein [Prevotella sp.]
MKKNLLFLAMAAVALASCSNDETTSVNESLKDANAISFRPFMNNITRGATDAGVMTAFATGNSFNVYADYDGSKYFQTDFTKQDGSTFTSSNKYYYPSDLGAAKGTEPETYKTLTFTAIYGATQIANTAGAIDDYTPAAAATSQVDVLVAKRAITSSPGSTGVVLDFRHALSQIVVKVKNTNANLKLTISDVQIGQVKTIGDFAYTGDGTGKVAQSDWTPATPGAYTQSSLGVTFTGTNGGTRDNEVVTLGSPWLIVPQDKVNTAEYSTANDPAPSITSSTTPNIVGNYLALKMTIKNNDASGTVIASERWCCWPIDQDFDPGYKYVFIIDAGSGGYQPVDINNDKTDLDPVLGDVIVFSASCTIADWDTDLNGDSNDDDDIDVNIP